MYFTCKAGCSKTAYLEDKSVNPSPLFYIHSAQMEITPHRLYIFTEGKGRRPFICDNWGALQPLLWNFMIWNYRTRNLFFDPRTRTIKIFHIAATLTRSAVFSAHVPAPRFPCLQDGYTHIFIKLKFQPSKTEVSLLNRQVLAPDASAIY